MKLFRALFVLAAFVCASAAVAAPVNYNFAAYNFQGLQGVTAPNANLVGSFTLDGSTVTAIDLTIGSHTYSTSEVGYDWLLGGLACSTACMYWGTDDFWLVFDANTLAFQHMYYAISGRNDDIWYTYSGVISTGAAHVPESGALVLMLIGLFGLAARKLKVAA